MPAMTWGLPNLTQHGTNEAVLAVEVVLLTYNALYYVGLLASLKSLGGYLPAVFPA